MNCIHGIRRDKDCKWCATGTEPTESEDAQPGLELIACNVADDWLTWRKANPEKYAKAPGRQRGNLNALELATRSSPLRKVKP